jgi:REP element-mobilizing transposase RayT
MYAIYTGAGPRAVPTDAATGQNEYLNQVFRIGFFMARRRERKRWKQMPLVRQVIPGERGGYRPGAGRPRKPGAGVPHRRRPVLKRRTALHITVRVRDDVAHLRRSRMVKALAAAFRGGCAKAGYRLCHFSVQGNHIHLIVEADDAAALAVGMKGWSVRVARAINRVMGRKGKVFRDRYHAVLLRTARQVRAALCYVLQNARRHGLTVETGRPDPYSSAWWFTGWQHERWRAGLAPPPEGPTVVAAEGWLLTAGWRRCGPIGIDEVPPAASATR